MRYTLIALLALFCTVAFAGTKSTADVVWLNDGSVVDDASADLKRQEKGITFNIKTELDPGTYTVWTFVTDSNGLLGVEVSTGHVVGSNGQGNFSGHVVEGTALNEFGSLTDPDTNGIVHIIRSHGDPLPGHFEEDGSPTLPAQISSFSGGCSENDCADVQLVIHHPL
jgi:hypothetical protein